MRDRIVLVPYQVPLISENSHTCVCVCVFTNTKIQRWMDVWIDRHIDKSIDR